MAMPIKSRRPVLPRVKSLIVDHDQALALSRSIFVQLEAIHHLPWEVPFKSVYHPSLRGSTLPLANRLRVSISPVQPGQELSILRSGVEPVTRIIYIMPSHQV